MITLVLGALLLQDQDLAELERAIDEARYEDALRILDGLQGDPPDPGLEFLRGTFLNRLGRHGEALAVLEKLDDPANPNLHLERGVSFYWTGAHDRAIESLRKALDMGVTRTGEARTILGASLAATGRLQEAQDEFEKAGKELDPQSPLFDSAREWRDYLTQALTGAPSRPYGARVKFGYGHSSNALRIGSDAPLPGNVSGRSSYYFHAQGTFWVDVLDEGDTRLRLSASPEVRDYFDVAPFSYVTLPLSALLTHDIDDTFTFGAGFNWDTKWMMNPGRKFHRTYEPLVYAEARWSAETSTRVTVSRPMTKYFIGGLSGATDPDSDAWRVRVQQILYLDAERQFAIVPAIGYTWNDADGSDWDYGALDASIAAVARPLEELTIAGGLYYATYDYTHDHSFSAAPRERRDNTLVPFITATVQVNAWFGVTASFSHTDNASNIGVFDYTNTEWSVMPYIDLGELIAGDD